MMLLLGADRTRELLGCLREPFASDERRLSGPLLSLARDLRSGVGELLCRALGAAGRKRVEGELTLEAMTRRIGELYRSLLQSTAQRQAA